MGAGALITPIPKSRDKDPCVPLNYRGISLLCTISKVYSSVLNNRINKYFNMVNLLSDYQNGLGGVDRVKIMRLLYPLY